MIKVFGAVGLTLSLLTVNALAEGAQEPNYPPPEKVELPAPTSGRVLKLADVVGWPEGVTPVAPKGFVVSSFGSDLESPRWMLPLPNGDVLVAESRTEFTSEMPASLRPFVEELKKTKSWGESPNRITLLRDADRDGIVDEQHVLLEGLKQPLGMAVHNDFLYVANTNALKRFPFSIGETRISEEGQNLQDLPADGYNNHWTRNVVVSPDGAKLYVSVGSATNVDVEKFDEKDFRRATILEMNLDGSDLKVFASGLRNPVGLDFEPGTDVLFTTVNERDMLGDDLVPDFLTSVRRGAFYGWPYSYFGSYEDPRKKGERDDLVAKAIIPDLSLGAHTASLGLAFYSKDAFPSSYQGGAFIGQHGSSNRSEFSGYKVIFAPFKDGQPEGKVEDFVTGFISNSETGKVYGRPAGVSIHVDGSLLVADDAGNRIWRVAYKGGE